MATLKQLEIMAAANKYRSGEFAIVTVCGLVLDRTDDFRRALDVARRLTAWIGTEPRIVAE